MKIPFTHNETSFSELFDVIKRGKVLRDCGLKYVDKLSNVKYDKTIVFTTKPLAEEDLNNGQITGILTNHNLGEYFIEKTDFGVWICDDPQDLFFSIHEHMVRSNFCIKPWENSISESAIISPLAIIGDHSVTIGSNTIVEAGAVIYPFTVVGENCNIGSHCNVGSDGFEVHIVNGINRIIKHGGMVFIGNNVEMLPMVKITRGLSPSRNTVIYDNVKIDSITHVAHGAIIEKDTIIVGGVTVAGNVHIKKNAYLGPGSIISNRLSVGENAYISIGSVVISNIKDNAKVSGNFALDHQDNLTRHIYLKNQLKRNN